MKPARDYDTDPLTETEAAILDELDNVCAELEEERHLANVRGNAILGACIGLLLGAYLTQRWNR